jgi:hypothetical protein
MPLPTLTSFENAIRRAVAADSFLEAQTLLGEYVAEVERQLRAMPAGPEEMRALEKRTHKLFEWTNAMALAARGYAAAELSHLRLLARYRNSAGSSRHFGTRA